MCSAEIGNQPELDEALALLADEAGGGATSTATCILQTGPIGAPQTEKRTPSPNGSKWSCSCWRSAMRYSRAVSTASGSS